MPSHPHPAVADLHEDVFPERALGAQDDRTALRLAFDSNGDGSTSSQLLGQSVIEGLLKFYKRTPLKKGGLPLVAGFHFHERI